MPDEVCGPFSGWLRGTRTRCVAPLNLNLSTEYEVCGTFNGRGPDDVCGTFSGWLRDRPVRGV